MFSATKRKVAQPRADELGGGGRFQKLVDKGVSPALAATIGRKLYGKKRMANMATKGK